MNNKIIGVELSTNIKPKKEIIQITEKDIDFSAFNEFTNEMKLTLYLGSVALSFDSFEQYSNCLYVNRIEQFIPREVEIKFYHEKLTLNQWLKKNMIKMQHWHFHLTKNMTCIQWNPHLFGNLKDFEDRLRQRKLDESSQNRIWTKLWLTSGDNDEKTNNK